MMKGVLLLSGANQRAVITFLRFCDQQNIPVFIIANGEEDTIFLSSYKTNVVYTRRYNELVIEDILLACAGLFERYQYEEIFIPPSSEYLNRFLLTNRTTLENKNIRLGLCDLELYEKISDKRSFTDLCGEFKIKVPTESDGMPDRFPFVCKPKNYFFKDKPSAKPVIIENESQLELLDKGVLDQFFYQQYISGESFYLLFHFGRSGSYSVYSQRNLIQQDKGGSMILCISSDIHENWELVDQYVNLFSSVNFHGLVMVELKYFEGNYYMIEANPRLWGPLQLILNSGMNLLHDYVADNGMCVPIKIGEDEYKKDVFYYWGGGIVQNNGLPLKYHGYDANSFMNSFEKIIPNEIYLKEDTIEIYLKENNG